MAYFTVGIRPRNLPRSIFNAVTDSDMTYFIEIGHRQLFYSESVVESAAWGALLGFVCPARQRP